MRKSYAIVAIFSIILCAIAGGITTSSDVQVTFNERYENFTEAFSEQFKDKNDIWLVLGNRGTTNYYRERFSENWIFWDYCSSSNGVGISGNFLDPKNWKQVSSLLPRAVNYIAVDFNDLVNDLKRNKIINAAKNILNSGGIFCIEDIYDNRQKQFQHFTDKDFQQLSKDFDIKYAYWDGYISALPYTSDQSVNEKSDMFKGLEMMILRLAAANFKEKKRMFPNISLSLSIRSFLIGKDTINKLIRDIVDSAWLRQVIQNYENDSDREKQTEEMVEKEKKEIESLKKDIENFTRLAKLSRGAEKGSGIISETVSAIDNGMNYLMGTQQKEEPSVTNKESENTKKDSNESEDLQKQLEEKNNQLAASERRLTVLQSQLEMIKNYVKDSTEKIMKYNNEIFSRFGKDKYLKSYVSYKKEKLEDIISDSKDSDDEFWKKYDGIWNSTSNIEILATELEKIWSPNILIENSISLERIKSDAEQKVSDTSKIVIMFIKK